MYATLTNMLSEYNCDVAKLIMINYWKLNQVDFKNNNSTALFLYQTRVYQYQRKWLDLGLSNIRAIECDNFTYFAVSYDNELYAWGENAKFDNITEEPKIILKSIIKVYPHNDFITMINCSHEFFYYELDRLPIANVKEYVYHPFQSSKVITYDNQLVDIRLSEDCINNVKSVNSKYILLTNGEISRQDGKIANVKEFKSTKTDLYVLSTNNVLSQLNKCRSFSSDNLIEIIINVKSFSIGQKSVFIVADQRYIYDDDGLWPVNYDVIFGQDAKLIIENNKFTFYGKIFGGQVSF